MDYLLSEKVTVYILFLTLHDLHLALEYYFFYYFYLNHYQFCNDKAQGFKGWLWFRALSQIKIEKILTLILSEIDLKFVFLLLSMDFVTKLSTSKTYSLSFTLQ